MLELEFSPLTVDQNIGLICFFKIEDNGAAFLLIFFLEAFRIIAFGLLH
jgi:hypothetical protein